MFTLKLYQTITDCDRGESGRVVIMETVGVWADHCSGDVKHIRAFKKTLGVMDDGGTPEFYVGGSLNRMVGPKDDAIVEGSGGNYFAYAILENAQGKTTEVFR